MSGSVSPPMSSLSAYHQTLSNHISSILSQLPSAPTPQVEQHSSSASTADAASAAIPAVPTLQERNEEFQKAWQAEGHARHATLSEDFNLQLGGPGPSGSREEIPTPGREVPESASSRKDRHQRRVDRSKRRIEMWRARMDVTCLASPSIPPTPIATSCSFFPSTHSSEPLSKVQSHLPVPTNPPAVAVFAPKCTPLCIPRRSIDPERIALERQINKRLAATSGNTLPLPSPAASELQVLDSLAQCLGLVADLGKVQCPSTDAPYRASTRRKQRDQPRLQLL